MATTISAEIPFVDLKAQYATIREEVLAELADVLEGMQLFLGPRQRAFEADFAAYCEATDCISMSNGTDALELALRALGVGPGDEILTQPNSFIATAEAISATGATPTFADVDERTATLDPVEVAKRITPRTKAIIPVHLYGRPADMAGLRKVAGAIPIIEDACQAHGARYQGRRAGSLGELACFSFYFSKNLGAYGEGGAVTTSDPALAERVRMVRDHGSKVRYEHDVVGRNARMDELQAAILNVKLRYLDGWNTQRRANAAKLSAALANTSLTFANAGWRCRSRRSSTSTSSSIQSATSCARSWASVACRRASTIPGPSTCNAPTPTSATNLARSPSPSDSAPPCSRCRCTPN